MAELLYRVGAAASRRRLGVVVAWLAILAIAAGAFLVFGKTPGAEITIPGTPTALATERLAEAIPGAADATGMVVFHTTDGAPLSEAQRSAIVHAIEDASDIEGVTAVVDPFATELERDAQALQVNAGRLLLGVAQAQQANGEAQLEAARAEPDADQAELAARQASLDQSAASLAAQARQLEAGATLLATASGIGLVSADESAALVPVQFAATGFDIPQAAKDGVQSVFSSAPIEGVEVDFSATIVAGIPNLLGGGELVGVAIAAVVLFVMLGTLVGSGLPIVTALIGVGISALGTLSLAGVVDMMSVTPILGVMLGLAVGIDYTLFIVNRHRHQLMDGYTVAESVALANGTSGNAVLFAGSTVFIALLALNLTGVGFLGLMGTVGALAIAIAVLIAVTLTPALLSFIGLGILRGREREHLADREGPAPRTPARPLSTGAALGIAAAGIVALIVIAIPAASLRLGLPLGSAESPESTERRAYDVTEARFGAGTNGPLIVVADLPGEPGELELLEQQAGIAQRLAAFPDVVAVAPLGASADRSVTAFQVLPAEGPLSVSTERLVHALRAASPLDGEVVLGVAGQTTGNIDISARLAASLPVYLLVVVGLSLVIMVVVFRSLFVPLVATGGFILSFFAAIGGVVTIYQWGWLGGLFGVTTPGPVLNFLPTVLVGVLFGLAMDYMLFLTTGMREAYAHGAAARTAVILGVRAGRAVVIAAAIIMAAVFGGFVLSESAIIRPIGFALAFGVLVDAFIVRLLIMPALMTLAGDWAWWLPRWLDRLLPDVDIEGAALERQHPHVAGVHLDAEAGLGGP